MELVGHRWRRWWWWWWWLAPCRSNHWQALYPIPRPLSISILHWDGFQCSLLYIYSARNTSRHMVIVLLAIRRSILPSSLSHHSHHTHSHHITHHITFDQIKKSSYTSRFCCEAPGPRCAHRDRAGWMRFGSTVAVCDVMMTARTPTQRSCLEPPLQQAICSSSHMEGETGIVTTSCPLARPSSRFPCWRTSDKWDLQAASSIHRRTVSKPPLVAEPTTGDRSEAGDGRSGSPTLHQPEGGI